RMLDIQILDDDRRLDDGAAAVDEHGHTLHGPKPREGLVGTPLEAEEPDVEGSGALVKRRQHLLAAGRERESVEREGHDAASSMSGGSEDGRASTATVSGT